MATYKVKAGDTWWGIAEQNLGSGTEYPSLIEANPDINMLHPGDVVNIPGSNQSMTQSRANLFGVSPVQGRTERNARVTPPDRRQTASGRQMTGVPTQPSGDVRETTSGQQMTGTPQPPKPQSVGAGPTPGAVRGIPDYRTDIGTQSPPQNTFGIQSHSDVIDYIESGGDVFTPNTPVGAVRGIPDYRTDIQVNERPEITAQFAPGPPQNPNQAIRAEYQSNPYFDMTRLSEEFGSFNDMQNLYLTDRQKDQLTAAEMRADTAKWENLYGEIPIRDEGDLWINRQLGIIEPTTDPDEDDYGIEFGGGGYGGGLKIQNTRMRGRGGRPPTRQSNYRSILGLVNWRI